MSLEVRGLAELMAKLDKLGGDVDKAMQTGMKHATAVVQASAKAGCPVDLGQLRASIMRSHEVAIHSIIGKVGTNVEYAPYVEFGTGIHTTKGTGRQTPWSFQMPDGNWVTTRGQRPQPYLYPALTSNRKEILKAFEWSLTKAIKKVGK